MAHLQLALPALMLLLARAQNCHARRGGFGRIGRVGGGFGRGGGEGLEGDENGNGGNGNSQGGLIAGVIIAVVVIVGLAVLAYFLYRLYKRKQRRQQQHGGPALNNKPHGNQNGPKKGRKNKNNKKQNQNQNQQGQQGAGYGGPQPEAASPGKPHNMAAYGPVGAGGGAYESTYGAQGAPGQGTGEGGSVYSLYGQSDNTQSTVTHQTGDEHSNGQGQQPGYSLYGDPPQAGPQAAANYPDPWHGGTGGGNVPAAQPPSRYPAI